MQPFFNFHGSAVLSFMVFFGTALLLLCIATALLVLLLTGRLQPARWLVRGALLVVLAYLGILLAVSLGSREHVLAPQEEKYFCEVDCHLAYSVLAVSRARTLGRPPHQSTARGVYYVVRVRVRFDEETTSATRSDQPLHPHRRSVRVLDAGGRRYAPSLEGQHALEAVGGRVVPLTRPLRPGASYRTQLVFDLPADIRDPRLLITEAGWATRLLIGHENSFLHRKTSFRLEPRVQRVARGVAAAPAAASAVPKP